MVESGLLVPVIFVGVIITSFFLAGVGYLQGKRRTVQPPHQQVPHWIQQEIDQTPEWWDREFRKLSGEPIPWGQAVEAQIKQTYSPSAWDNNDLVWSKGEDIFIGGPGPAWFTDYRPSTVTKLQEALDLLAMTDTINAHLELTRTHNRPERTEGFFNLYCPKEGDSYSILPSRPEHITKFLTKYGLDAREIAEDGWNSLGYWFLTDEWEYHDVRTFAQAESVLEPTYRIREWREWPEGFDYEGMVKAWNGH